MKKDIDANKRFIDSAKDTRRQAYDRRATTIPRHCVFFITTNNKMCLTDMTGNRRYPIIVCHNKPRQYVEGLTNQYIQQVWAEVFAHYNTLFKDGFDERKLVLSAILKSSPTKSQRTICAMTAWKARFAPILTHRFCRRFFGFFLPALNATNLKKTAALL